MDVHKFSWREFYFKSKQIHVKIWQTNVFLWKIKEIARNFGRLVKKYFIFNLFSYNPIIKEKSLKFHYILLYFHFLWTFFNLYYFYVNDTRKPQWKILNQSPLVALTAQSSLNLLDVYLNLKIKLFKFL